MIGILLVSHSDYASGALHSVQMISGEHENIAALGFYESDDLQVFEDTFLSKVIQLDEGQGVLVFTDLFGASPYNIGAKIYLKRKVDDHPYRLISGMNLSMILEAIFASKNDENTLNDIYKVAMEAGILGISELLETLDLEVDV